MKIGIDKIGFSTTNYTLILNELAEQRGIDPAKLSKGLLLDEISITPITEDIVTLGASAAETILTDEDKKDIDMVIIATESGIDQSKAAAIFIHNLLGIQPFARSFEIKEACYGATAALDYAKLHINNNLEAKVLVIASDIAKYGIGTPGEPTQGAGAVAMLISAQPRILFFNNDNVAQTRDIMDFWRPNYSSIPFVDGIYSTQQYLDSLQTIWSEYQRRYDLTLKDFAAYCFHIPYPKLALKGLHKIMDKTLPIEHKKLLISNFHNSILYSQKVGNIYTGSLFLGLLSLLENSPHMKEDDKIALFSYGSGSVSEIFSVNLIAGFKNQLNPKRMDTLNQRQKISVTEYERIFFENITLDSEGNTHFDHYDQQDFALTGIVGHKRRYSKVNK